MKCVARFYSVEQYRTMSEVLSFPADQCGLERCAIDREKVGSAREVKVSCMHGVIIIASIRVSLDRIRETSVLLFIQSIARKVNSSIELLLLTWVRAT